MCFWKEIPKENAKIGLPYQPFLFSYSFRWTFLRNLSRSRLFGVWFEQLQWLQLGILCEKSKRQRSLTNFARKLHQRYLLGSWICLCNEESLWIIFMFDVRTMEGQSGIMHLLRTQKLPKNYLLTPDTHTRTYKRNGWCLTSNILLDIWEYTENLQGWKL